MRTPTLTSGALRQPSGSEITRVLIGIVVVMLSTLPLLIAGLLDPRVAAVVGVLGIGLLAGLGALATVSASRRSAGQEARFWQLISIGLLSWCLGALPYVVFVVTGGSLSNPAAWSQIGFLLAYPFWYRALWLVRQPVIAESQRARLESLAIEFGVFIMLAAVCTGLLWNRGIAAERNIALMVPVALDLLLLASLYNAVRRSQISHRGAIVWFAYGFAVLALTDGLVTFLVTRAPVEFAGIAMLGYLGAMALMAVAARRPLRATEARAALGPSTAALAALGLALCGPASALAPAVVRPAIWTVAGVLLWRLVALLRSHRQSDTDAASGFLEERAFQRHLAGVIQGATPGRPALMIAVDLDGFARWNAQHGYSAGDALLSELAIRLESGEPEGGTWSRLGPDRFAWIGGGHNPADARALAEAVRRNAADNAGGLGARATFVMLPTDATTAANALAAVDEGLAAAKSGNRTVVAFDRGRLDGVEFSAGYTASLAQRREKILEILRAPSSIEMVFQPIVRLADGRTVGFEALARFRTEPNRSPDRWIAEAHAVGLGMEVELECVRRACASRGHLPDGAYVSVNMSPDAILAPEMGEALGERPLDGLVIEITEHDAVVDYARLAARLAEFRGQGALVAIDDTGAGYASLRHVTQLTPDYVKVDRSLIEGVHLDDAKRAIVGVLVEFERRLGAQVIAEGIESAEELRVLNELGVPLAQGFLLAKPHPDPAAVSWDPSWLADGERVGAHAE